MECLAIATGPLNRIANRPADVFAAPMKWLIIAVAMAVIRPGVYWQPNATMKSHGNGLDADVHLPNQAGDPSAIDSAMAEPWIKL